MQFEFWEGEHGAQLIMKPETPKEMAELLRMTNNAKREPVSLNFDFGVGPQLSVWVPKVEKCRQRNSISTECNSRKKSAKK
jgi:hypothetical protein